MNDPPLHPASLAPDDLSRQCRAERFRRRGPGGQHRNKVETAVRLTHLPSGVSGEATERRSQHQNRQRALARLRVNLALEIRLPAGADRIPSERWRGHLAAAKIHINPEHEDFAAMLAEALDFLAARDHDIRAAAEALGCSPSQLVKFLKLEPRALEKVNRERIDRGLDRLR